MLHLKLFLAVFSAQVRDAGGYRGNEMPYYPELGLYLPPRRRRRFWRVGLSVVAVLALAGISWGAFEVYSSSAQADGAPAMTSVPSQQMPNSAQRSVLPKPKG